MLKTSLPWALVQSLSFSSSSLFSSSREDVMGRRGRWPGGGRMGEVGALGSIGGGGKCRATSKRQWGGGRRTSSLPQGGDGGRAMKGILRVGGGPILRDSPRNDGGGVGAAQSMGGTPGGGASWWREDRPKRPAGSPTPLSPGRRPLPIPSPP